MTLRQVFNALEGYGERENRRVELVWEVSRWQVMYLLTSHTKKKIKARDLIVFPWEKSEIVVKSREEILEIANNWNKRKPKDVCE
jgi:hypothetical protein